MPRDYKLFVEDIVEAIRRIERYADGNVLVRAVVT
jgi:hypothetical protein